MSGRAALDGRILARLKAARAAARVLRASPAARRDAVLASLAGLLRSEESALLKANAKDLGALPRGAAPAFRDRLTLDSSRVMQMIQSLEQVAALADPVGEIVESRTLASGLKARRVRSPLGVILLIFESRPNVALEACSLAFKSGNVILLKGGKESRHTTDRIYALIRRALEDNGFDPASAWGIHDPGRALVPVLLKQRAWIDIVVPRGGDKLIEFVVSASEIPIIKNDRGLCHVYVHGDADLAMAGEIVFNAKVSRPGVCNSMETVLVHEGVAADFIPKLHARMAERGVQWRGCPKTLALLRGRAGVKAAKGADWDTEYLDLIMNCRVVSSFEEAIAHIDAHGSRHSEAIVTRSEAAARRFQDEIDAAAVYWNASTRFTDGFEMGLGGELGISTQKLHVRGPVGLRELTSVRWVIDGSGQVR